jgi:hypothetical protein
MCLPKKSNFQLVILSGGADSLASPFLESKDLPLAGSGMAGRVCIFNLL